MNAKAKIPRQVRLMMATARQAVETNKAMAGGFIGSVQIGELVEEVEIRIDEETLDLPADSLDRVESDLDRIKAAIQGGQIKFSPDTAELLLGYLDGNAPTKEVALQVDQSGERRRARRQRRPSVEPASTGQPRFEPEPPEVSLNDN